MGRSRVSAIGLRSLNIEFEGPSSRDAKVIAFLHFNYLVDRLVGWLGRLEWVSA